jgi:hypothetical protein
MAKNAALPSIDKDYQAEDDHRTITRAQEICDDKKRMAGVRRHHQKMTRSLTKVGAALGRKGKR